MRLVNKKDYADLFEKAARRIGCCFDKDGTYKGAGVCRDFGCGRADWLKGFALPLWGFAPYFSYRNTSDFWKKAYAEGIKNGTNPFCPDYWGEVSGCEEKTVAMAAVAAALLFGGDFIKDFGDVDRRKLADWLCSINECRLTDIRHILCRLIVNIGLKNASMPYSDTAIEDAVRELGGFYAGDGVYIDARSGSVDFAFCAEVHFYSLIYAKYIEKAYPERSERIKERARLFAQQLARTYDAGGGAAVFGRFTGNRVRMLGFWAAFLWAGVQGASAAEVKCIINRTVGFWAKQPIFDTDGMPVAGYKYPNARIAGDVNIYNNFEVFALFILLALPEEHEFFACDEPERGEYEAVYPVESAKMIITSSPTNSVIYPGGGTDFAEPERYAKLAYSSKFGYCMPVSQRSLELEAPDSMLCFKINGFICTSRGANEAELLPDKRIRTVWSPCEGIEVETVITPFESSHKREHTIRAAFSCTAYDCGFAVDVHEKTAAVTNKTTSSEVMTADGGCRIYSEYGEGVVIDAAKNTNTLSPEAKIPALEYSIPIGESKISSTVYEL